MYVYVLFCIVASAYCVEVYVPVHGMHDFIACNCPPCTATPDCMRVYNASVASNSRHIYGYSCCLSLV